MGQLDHDLCMFVTKRMGKMYEESLKLEQLVIFKTELFYT